MIYRIINTIFGLLSSTKVALVLLLLICLSCLVGASLPRAAGKEVVFTSLWFNLLLVLLIVNIVFCIVKRTRLLLLSQAGTTIFHLGLVALFTGVVYDQLFYFEGTIRLTEGESLRCAEPASYDRVKMGRFFQPEKLRELGMLYLHKLHTSYEDAGRSKGIANEIALGDDAGEDKRQIVYVTHPVKYKRYEFYRVENDGYSPLIVLRDRQGRVLYGGFTPLQSIRQQDGSYIYRSGSAFAPGSFFFPQEEGLPIVFRLQIVYHPDKTNNKTGEIAFQIWGIDAHSREPTEALFDGKVALGERVKAGEYFFSMEEVRYWTSMNVNYRPGLPLIFGSFWIIFGGLVLNLILKAAKSRGEEGAA